MPEPAASEQDASRPALSVDFLWTPIPSQSTLPTTVLSGASFPKNQQIR